MPLINYKVELSLRWTENYIFTLNPNTNNNINKTVFTINDVKR